MIENKFCIKDVLCGYYIDYPYRHGKIVLYAIDNNIEFKQNKFYNDNKSTFITELKFNTKQEEILFYKNEEKF